MSTLPVSNYISDAARTVAEVKAALEAIRDAAAAAMGIADVRLIRHVTYYTYLTLQAITGSSKIIEIANEPVSLAGGDINVTTAQNLLSSSGGDSGGVPQVSATYYVYASNSLASYRPSGLGLSTTAPTGGYLATSGNGANWRHVGWCRTAATPAAPNTEFSDEWYVCSRFNAKTKTLNTMGSGTATNATQNAWEDVASAQLLQKYILIPPNWLALVESEFAYKATSALDHVFKSLIGSIEGSYENTRNALNNVYFTAHSFARAKPAALGWILCKSQLYTNCAVGALTIAGGHQIITLIPEETA